MLKTLRLALFSFVLFLSACSTYQFRVQKARDAMRAGNYAQAAEALKERAFKESDDQLVYLLDYAIALQYAGRYEESNKALQLADQLSEVKDYTSISREAGSLFVGDALIQYEGDDYEKVLINAFGAINYLMLGNLESALVEARRLNEKLQLYKDEAKKNYEQNVFARYISAIAWEADGEFDSSYIDYEKAYQLNPSIPALQKDLIRAAIRAQRPQAARKWKKEFGSPDLGNQWRDPNYGEIVLVYQQGWGPKKRPNPAWTKLPKLYPVRTRTRRAKMLVRAPVSSVRPTSDPKLPSTSTPTPVAKAATSSPQLHRTISKKTDFIYSVQDVAIKTLDDHYAGILAKRVAGQVAKHVVRNEINKKNRVLGELAFLAMQVADQADLRQWGTLPESFQVARVFVEAGTYSVSVLGLSDSGIPTGEMMDPKEVTVLPGKKIFLNWRSFN